MSDTINGRTPEEIKRGLECCVKHKKTEEDCGDCAYHTRPSKGVFVCWNNEIYQDILALINQLQEDKKQLERERDAAVEDMTELMQLAQFCRHCKHLTEDGECTFDFVANKGEPWCWQWRGIQEVE